MEFVSSELLLKTDSSLPYDKTLTISLPAAAQVGDLVFVHMFSFNLSSEPLFDTDLTAISGAGAVSPNLDVQAFNNDNAYSHYLWYRIIDGNEAASYDFTLTFNSDYRSAIFTGYIYRPVEFGFTAAEKISGNTTSIAHVGSGLFRWGSASVEANQVSGVGGIPENGILLHFWASSDQADKVFSEAEETPTLRGAFKNDQGGNGVGNLAVYEEAVTQGQIIPYTYMQCDSTFGSFVAAAILVYGDPIPPDPDARIKSHFRMGVSDILNSFESAQVAAGESFFFRTFEDGEQRTYADAFQKQLAIFDPQRLETENHVLEYTYLDLLKRIDNKYPPPYLESVDTLGIISPDGQRSAKDWLNAYLTWLQTQEDWEWLDFETIPDLYLRLPDEDGVYNTTLRTAALTIAQPENEELTLKEILENFLEIFEPHKLIATSDYKLKIVPFPESSANLQGPIVLSWGDLYNFPFAYPKDTEPVINHVRVESRGYSFQDEQELINPSYRAFLFGEFGGTYDLAAIGIDTYDSPPGGLAPFIEGTLIPDTDRTVNFTVFIYDVNGSGGTALVYSNDFTLTVPANAGAFHFQKNVFITAGAYWLDFYVQFVDEGDGLRVSMLEQHTTTNSSSGNSLVYFVAFDAQATTWTQNEESVTGQYSFDETNGELINSQELYGIKKKTITSNFFQLTAEQATDIARAAVNALKDPRIRIRLELAPIRDDGFALGPDDIGREVVLPDGYHGVLDDFQYVDDFETEKPLVGAYVWITVTAPPFADAIGSDAVYVYGVYGVSTYADLPPAPPVPPTPPPPTPPPTPTPTDPDNPDPINDGSGFPVTEGYKLKPCVSASLPTTVGVPKLIDGLFWTLLSTTTYHRYSNYSVFNPSNEYIVLNNGAVLRVSDWTIIHTISASGHYTWANTLANKNVIYKKNGLKLQAENVITGAVSDVHDFSGDGYDALEIGTNEGPITDLNDTWIVILGRPTGTTNINLRFFNIQTGLYGAGNYILTGRWGLVDHAYISTSGLYAIFKKRVSGHATYGSDPTVRIRRSDMNELELASPGEHAANTTFDQAGNEVLPTVGGLRSIRLDTGAVTYLLSAAGNGKFGHMYAPPELPGWVVYSNSSSSNSELLMIKLDSSGQIRHFGCNHNPAADPEASGSRDGRCLVVKSGGRSYLVGAVAKPPVIS